MAHIKHKESSSKSLLFSLITVSTSRYEKKKRNEQFSDESGDIAEKIIIGKNHAVVRRSLISDDSGMILKELEDSLSSNSDVILFIGGTGLSKRDITVETVRKYFEKEVVGFGELVRMLSYQRIGASAMLSRTTAGIARGKLIVCLPGSPDAVELALNATLDEFPHIVYIART